MSALLAPQPSKSRRAEVRLRPMPQVPVKRSNTPFVGLIAVVLGVGMAGVIVLNTVIEQQSRELLPLQREVTSLANEEELLIANANELRSPRVLALKASSIGMVPNPHPVYIKLPDGEILGKPSPVTGRELPGMTGVSG